MAIEYDEDGNPVEVEYDEQGNEIRVETSKAPTAPPIKPFGSAWMDALGGVVSGAAKGVPRTVGGLGQMVHMIPGVSRGMDALLGQPGVSEESFEAVREATAPQGTAEKVGQGLEQTAEFVAIPGPSKVRAASKGVKAVLGLGRAATGAGLARAQGASPEASVAAGVLTAVPVGEGVQAVGRWAKSRAVPAVRAAIKPTVTAMKRIAGASATGIDAKANGLVEFIIENRLTTPEKAVKIFEQAERELQRLLSVRNAPTDAATRAQRYLEALERSASRQGLPAADVAALRNAQAQLLEGPLGKDVVTMVSRPHPTLVDPRGNPIMVLVPETSRELRQTVPAAEALRGARASSQWSTRKQWGEMRGVDKEARKAVERGQRDAIKDAVPGSREILKREANALQAAEVLDRMGFRTANRDVISLPAWVAAAPAAAQGKVPVLAMAANWLRNNQMKAGIYANDLARAIEQGNVTQVAVIMQRLGVGGLLEPARP